MVLETRLRGPLREPVTKIEHWVWQEEFNCLSYPASLFNWHKKALRAFRNRFSWWQWIHPQDIEHLYGLGSAWHCRRENEMLSLQRPDSLSMRLFGKVERMQAFKRERTEFKTHKCHLCCINFGMLLDFYESWFPHLLSGGNLPQSFC